MLEVAFHRRGLQSPIGNTSAFKMPVDFASYLLSASPPGFEFYSLRDKYAMGVGKAPLRSACSSVRSLIQRSQSDMCLTSKAGGTSDMFSSTDSSSDSELCDKMSTLTIAARPASRQVHSKKSVSFADEMGWSLTQVRVMTETSDTPPRLRPELLASLTQGATVEATSVGSPPLVLDFRQPASDYVAFRESIESNNVSLENVILKDYKLIGTVKVKNIAFHKSVNVRVTYDGWDTFTDIACSYVPVLGGYSAHLASPYDTFSFDVNIPPNFDVCKKVEFAVCFEANEQQYWDNNNGGNYCVLSSKWRAQQVAVDKEPSIFTMDAQTNWTEFSSWSFLDSSAPYY